jgi:predicted MPP superfamily phosphohydrolase
MLHFIKTNILMKKRNYLPVLLFFALITYTTTAWSAKIVRPWRSTTAIVKSGESFEVWFDANDGQTVDLIELESPYLTVSTTFTVESGDWEYDPLSGNRYNKHIIVTVPAGAPADRYNLVLKTSNGNVTSHGGVKVVTEFKTDYYIMHMSDGHIYQHGYDAITLFLKKTTMIDIANIMDCELIIETGDNMYSVRNHPEREVIYFQGDESVGVKGMADANAATFMIPGNHDAPYGNTWTKGTVQENSDFYNKYYGLQSYCFKYGNGRFMMLNNSWNISDHQYQTNAAVSWLDGGGAGGNFFLSAGHIYSRMHDFIDSHEPLDLVLAGHNHHLSKNNPHEFKSGRPAVAFIANSIREYFQFNLFRVNNSTGTMTPVSGKKAVVQALASGNMNTPSTWEPNLTLTYENENNGSMAVNTATIVNQFHFPIYDAKVRFVLLKGYNYIFDKGILMQSFEGDEHLIVDLNIDIMADSTISIHITADDFCPDDPDKTEPGLCGCGVPEGTCPSFPLVVNHGIGNGSYQPLQVATITADSAAEGMYFESWTIKSGTPTIDDTLAFTTTLTLGYDSAVVEPVYKEIPKVNNAAYVSQEVPMLIPGDQITVSVTMKNTGNTTWSKEGGFYLGSQRPADNTIWGLNRVSLDDGELVEPYQEKTFTFDIQVPLEEGTYIFQWQMIEEGVEWFGSSSSSKILRIGAEGIYLDDCDVTTGWNSSATLSLNNENNPQGDNCLEFTGNGTDEFKKAFAKPFFSGGTHDSIRLQFWYYISDDQKNSVDQVELGSSGQPDENEYNWRLTNLSAGWNFVSLKVKDAGVLGNPDLNAVNWFRLYNNKTENITSRIDAIEIIDPYAGKRYALTVNNGEGGGCFYSGSEVSIKADNDPTGQVFDKWEITAGSAEIADQQAQYTTITTSGSNTTVKATYKDDSSTTMENITSEMHMNLYPNPAEKEVTIDLTIQNKSVVTLNLLSISGKVICYELVKTSLNNGEHSLKFNVDSIKAGTYILELKIGEQRYRYTKNLMIN